jgi:pSer/pThr/pTyr-binding forkhead associated (FHA) protein
MDPSNDKQAYLKGLSDVYKNLEYTMDKEEFVIGRLPQCDLVINEETISARHAKIIQKENHFEILDLNSTNGTFVNGAKIDKKTLRTDDKVKFDVYEFQFINPADVARTMVSKSVDFEELQKTVVFPQDQTIRLPAQDQTIPMPTMKPKLETEPASAPEQKLPGRKTQPLLYKKKGNIFGGLILGLLIAFLLGYGGSFLGMWSSSSVNFSTANIQSLFLSSISIYPLMHLHTAWIDAPFTFSTIIAILGILLGLMIGGFVTQYISRKSRLLDAFLFSFFYVLLALFAQLAVMEFRFNGFKRLYYTTGVGIQETLINLILTIVYIFVISFIFPYLGTLISRK